MITFEEALDEWNRLAEEGKPLPKHGMSRTITARSWNAMNSRCLNRNYSGYAPYGGRGITVCEFLSDSPLHLVAVIGERPSTDYSLDRINPKGHYTCGKCFECERYGYPLNIRWATQETQCNNKIENVRIEIDGVTLTAAQWERKCNLKRGLIYKRIEMGWTGRRLIQKPKDKNRYLTLGGRTQSMLEWARELGIGKKALGMRLASGWTEAELLLPKQRSKQVWCARRKSK
jgi:hypothetical protein